MPASGGETSLRRAVKLPTRGTVMLTGFSLSPWKITIWEGGMMELPICKREKERALCSSYKEPNLHKTCLAWRYLQSRSH